MNNYIDRERLLSFERFDREVTGEEHTAEDVLMIIQTAPVADVEPVRHGQWYGDVDGYCKCSKCHQKAPLYMDGEALASVATEFCPHCGAKMDETIAKNERKILESVDMGRYIQADGKERSVSEWISLKDKLPDLLDPVLVRYKADSGASMDAENARVPGNGALRFIRQFDGWTPTHWMLLPELPKEARI